MKKSILTLGFSILVVSTLLTGCKNKEQKSVETPTESTKEQYQCPMKCTEEIFDKPGNCPVCEMELEKITKS